MKIYDETTAITLEMFERLKSLASDRAWRQWRAGIVWTKPFVEPADDLARSQCGPKNPQSAEGPLK